MKKILLLFCIALSLSCCRKTWIGHYTINAWYVKNCTEQTLIVKCPYSKSEVPSRNPIRATDLQYREFEIEPESEFTICVGMVPTELEIEEWSNYYFTKSAEAFGEDASWQILSEDGATLKSWVYSDRDLPDQRFFEMSEWRVPNGGGIWYKFVFDITPEDI